MLEVVAIVATIFGVIVVHALSNMKILMTMATKGFLIRLIGLIRLTRTNKEYTIRLTILIVIILTTYMLMYVYASLYI